MRQIPALLLGATLLAQASFAQEYADIPKDIDFPAAQSTLEAIRATGNLNEQRNHLWMLFAGVTRASGNKPVPVFLTWYGAGEVFADSSAAKPPATRDAPQAFSLPISKDKPRSNSAPLIIRAHYNLAAYHHIRMNGLENAAALVGNSNAHEDPSEGYSVPAFPRDAIVLKSVWWPVPDEGAVAMPVWDPTGNPPRATGNDYLTWSRVVAVSAGPGFGSDKKNVDVDFLGRAFKQVHAVGIDAFYHVTLDQGTADSLMLDPETRKVAGLVLGRPLHANDRLALVALHLATRELTDWVWGTFWWHDWPDQGPFAPPHPLEVPPPWRNYLMSVSFDADLPREPDGSAHVAFNPWLEGRFADGGHGGGLVSNCVSCHRRASTAADKPFLVTRGRDDSLRPASSDKIPVTTSSLWSLPLQAR